MSPRAPLLHAMGTPAVVVRNVRQGLDRNTCGQAAIATVLRAHGLLANADDGAAIDQVRAHHPPDLPFGFGTSARRIAAALSAHGLETEVIHSGWFGRRLAHARARLAAHLVRGLPAIVCLDGGQALGMPWSAHWAVALWMDDAGVRLGNVRGDGIWPFERFERAWACRHLPHGHNHAAVVARRPGIDTGDLPSRFADRLAGLPQPPETPRVSSG